MRSLVILVFCLAARPSDTLGWPVTGGEAGGSRYSPLDDIHRGNVRRLRVAWIYRHGDYREATGPGKYFKGTAFEATPILVERRLIFSTSFNRVIALNPETGAEIWTFDPKIDKGRRFANMLINGGVAYWAGRDENGNSASRVFLGTLDARLIALDVKTGKPCPGFGSGGTVNLLQGISACALTMRVPATCWRSSSFPPASTPAR